MLCCYAGNLWSQGMSQPIRTLYCLEAVHDLEASRVPPSMFMQGVQLEAAEAASVWHGTDFDLQRAPWSCHAYIRSLSYLHQIPCHVSCE